MDKRGVFELLGKPERCVLHKPQRRKRVDTTSSRTDGLTVGCIRLKERRWCFEHIAPNGNRAEMLRIRNEPSRDVYIDALFHYVVDFDLDGLIDTGSTMQIEALNRQERTPIAHVIKFFHRSSKRGEQFQPDFQKMYDDGIQIALKYFGE